MKLLVAGIVVVLALGGGVARADEELTYEELIDRGLDRYERADYPAATAAFAAAYAKRADSEALFYLAKSHQRAGQFEEALLYFDRFLEKSVADDRYREEARRYREMIARYIARREIPVPASSLELAPGPDPARPLAAILAPREDRADPRAWRQTAWWVSSATIVASMGLGWYASAQDGDRWEQVNKATQYTWWAGLGGVVYFYYTGFIREAPGESERLHVTPAVTLDTLGVSLDLDF